MTFVVDQPSSKLVDLLLSISTYPSSILDTEDAMPMQILWSISIQTYRSKLCAFIENDIYSNLMSAALGQYPPKFYAVVGQRPFKFHLCCCGSISIQVLHVLQYFHTRLNSVLLLLLRRTNTHGNATWLDMRQYMSAPIRTL